MIRINELLIEAGVHYHQLAFVHDEVQLSASREDQAQMAADLTNYAMKDVEHRYQFRCPLDS